MPVIPEARVFSISSGVAEAVSGMIGMSECRFWRMWLVAYVLVVSGICMSIKISC